MYTQEDLDQVLGEVHQGPVGRRSDRMWEMSMLNRYRRSPRKGYRALIPEQVREIRDRYDSNIFCTAIILAEDYEVTANYMREVLRGEERYSNTDLYGPPVKWRSASFKYFKNLETGTIGTAKEFAEQYDMDVSSIHRSAKFEKPVKGLRFIKLTQ